jgi:hypothetical protein
MRATVVENVMNIFRDNGLHPCTTRIFHDHEFVSQDKPQNFIGETSIHLDSGRSIP